MPYHKGQNPNTGRREELETREKRIEKEKAQIGRVLEWNLEHIGSEGDHGLTSQWNQQHILFEGSHA